ncbi:MAG: TetR/AcrR family transcriptional regulator [Clostridia bacterium]|nr:TetR/AcrR family transcriptional regulator [Clostridia bacterium]
MDQRIKASEEAMKGALIRLLQKKEPARITVVELCREAGVNRSTFYDRYGYMDGLVLAVLRDCVAYICLPEDVAAFFALEETGVPRSTILRYLKRFTENDIINIFCTCQKSELYRQLIIQIHVDLTLNHVYDPHRFYPTYFQNAGVINTVLQWMQDGQPIPLEELAEIIHQFSRSMSLNYPRLGK